MRTKRAKRKKEMGGKIDTGQARLGKKMDQLVLYTSLTLTVTFVHVLATFVHDSNI